MKPVSRRIVWALACYALGICGPWLVRPAAAQVPLGPHAELPCAACHLSGPDGAPQMPAMLRADQEFLCAKCHPDAVAAGRAASHPSGFVPTRTIPARFPLDARGRLTCGTCHDLHADAPVLLRDTAAWSCEQCHPR